MVLYWFMEIKFTAAPRFRSLSTLSASHSTVAFCSDHRGRRFHNLDNGRRTSGYGTYNSTDDDDFSSPFYRAYTRTLGENFTELFYVLF